jgi:hypothetical protein
MSSSRNRHSHKRDIGDAQFDSMVKRFVARHQPSAPQEDDEPWEPGAAPAEPARPDRRLTFRFWKRKN